MPSLFTRIIQGEIPCHRVGEDDRFLAFLDIAPLREGHTLVIPKVEVDRFFDLPADVLSGIMPFAQEVAARIQKAIPCDRVGVAVIGLEVPHAHVHLIPIDRMSDMDFARPKLDLTQDALAVIAERIRTA
ncbi:MAG: HIT family protein [Flavobacteriales bacterium]|nr:HIT family protein [Flavobacteriales bacterium]MBL0034940.1 HIT family protein [Flavobacteriales bacterium]